MMVSSKLTCATQTDTIEKTGKWGGWAKWLTPIIRKEAEIWKMVVF
jgi:hypothetical protein